MEDRNSTPSPSLERHYSPLELAEIMGLSRQTIYRIIDGEPGVIKIGGKEKGLECTRTTYRVPESVWRRIHEKLTIKLGNGHRKK